MSVLLVIFWFNFLKGDVFNIFNVCFWGWIIRFRMFLMIKLILGVNVLSSFYGYGFIVWFLEN